MQKNLGPIPPVIRVAILSSGLAAARALLLLVVATYGCSEQPKGKSEPSQAPTSRQNTDTPVSVDRIVTLTPSATELVVEIAGPDNGYGTPLPDACHRT